MARILLVDDDEGVRTTLETLLAFSYEVESASSAWEALEILSAKQFDCLISDIKMPGMSGLELMEIVKSKYPSLPAILISGHSDIKKEEVLSYGAKAMLWKPFDISELESLIDSYTAQQPHA